MDEFKSLTNRIGLDMKKILLLLFYLSVQCSFGMQLIRGLKTRFVFYRLTKNHKRVIEHPLAQFVPSAV